MEWLLWKSVFCCWPQCTPQVIHGLHVRKWKFFLGWPIFRSYVSLREGISPLDPEFQPNILPEKILTNYKNLPIFRMFLSAFVRLGDTHFPPIPRMETCKESSAHFFVYASFHCASRSTHRDFPAPAVFGAKPTGRVVKMDLFPKVFGHGFRCQQPQNFPGVAKKYLARWWLNQPPWKIFVQMGIFPKQGWK